MIDAEFRNVLKLILEQFGTLAANAENYRSGAADDYATKYGFSDVYDKTRKRSYYARRDSCRAMQTWIEEQNLDEANAATIDAILQRIDEGIEHLQISRDDWETAEHIRRKVEELKRISA